MKIYTILLSTLLVGCQSTSDHTREQNEDGWFVGENFLSQPPLNDEEYIAYQKKEPRWSSLLWQREGSEGDTYVINILKSKATAHMFRVSQDAPGNSSCSKFTSDVIDYDDRNGYPSIYWKTSCKIDNSHIFSLQLVIDGKDSIYHIRKLWKGSVTEDEIGLWQKHLKKTSLCDTRSLRHKCPEGYQRVIN